MKIIDADWATHQNALQAIRRQVFVQEQSVPEDLEWDGKDAHAYHWLAFDGERPVGTVRMLQDGHIGRMAVLKEYRSQGIGEHLLAQALHCAKRLNKREAWLHSQEHAIGFYEKFGFVAYGPTFMDAGIPHRSMRFVLRSQSLLGEDNGRIAVSDLPATVSSMLSQSRQQIRIFSESLNPAAFDSDDVRNALSTLARRHKSTEIRLLVLRPDLLAGTGHRLLELQRRLSSAILLKVLPEEQAGQQDEEFVVADRCGLIVSSRRSPGTHWADFNNRPLAQNYSIQFDQLWNQAQDDIRFRRLSL
ncbi:putative GNAT family N-acyltransferase [Litorivivens lipolytica]|uniref:Putative GNAT family N-acyltransferase n=1 Tax=Litorivivens lipolytica TaxID=1524264 RepID=A0A7W4Z4R7_9GAMM|nr:GNAT family N-acetyltransferase [Litorivivens lipolytica]MBB3046413.1 putative GNAT family N-acyltransferase [Litorivivens lipolytica]